MSDAELPPNIPPPPRAVPPPGGAAPPFGGAKVRLPPPGGRRPCRAGPPPNPALAGPPAGKVPLVAWPSVWADQLAGAASRPARATPSATIRTRGEAAATIAATDTMPVTMITVFAHAGAPEVLLITTSSTKPPRTTAAGASQSVERSARRNWPTPPPTSAAVNGASSET